VATIEFRNLSVPDAERVLAEVWNCLEEFELSSPRLAVKFRGEAEVTLQCRFSETLSARLVAMRLARWIAGNERRGTLLGSNPDIVLFPVFSSEPPIARQREPYSEAVFLRHLPATRPQ
jgi:hypothetical protein